MNPSRESHLARNRSRLFPCPREAPCCASRPQPPRQRRAAEAAYSQWGLTACADPARRRVRSSVGGAGEPGGDALTSTGCDRHAQLDRA